MHEREISRSIRTQETCVFGRKFPEELKAFLYEAYGEDPKVCGFTPEDIYGGIKADAAAYFAGKPGRGVLKHKPPY